MSHGHCLKASKILITQAMKTSRFTQKFIEPIPITITSIRKSRDNSPGSEGQYKKDLMPWIALRMVHLDGEDYGRSFVEEYLGDLKSLET